MNFLFLCTGNSCRSILAEATFNALAFERAYRTLRRRIEALLSLPLDDLAGDPTAFGQELSRIGESIA